MNESGINSDIRADAVPLTPREFDRWLGTQTSMPWALLCLAERALLTLKSMKQPAFGQSLTLQQQSAADLQAFTTAYAEWKR